MTTKTWDGTTNDRCLSGCLTKSAASQLPFLSSNGCSPMTRPANDTLNPFVGPKVSCAPSAGPLESHIASQLAHL